MSKEAKRRRKSVHHIYEYGKGKIRIFTGGQVTTPNGEKINVEGFVLSVSKDIPKDLLHHFTHESLEKTDHRIIQSDNASKPRIKLTAEDVGTFREQFLADHGTDHGWITSACAFFGIEQDKPLDPKTIKNRIKEYDRKK